MNHNGGNVNRRGFIGGLIATAAGLYLPYEPQRVYSYASSKYLRSVHIAEMMEGRGLILPGAQFESQVRSAMGWKPWQFKTAKAIASKFNPAEKIRTSIMMHLGSHNYGEPLDPKNSETIATESGSARIVDYSRHLYASGIPRRDVIVDVDKFSKSKGRFNATFGVESGRVRLVGCTNNEKATLFGRTPAPPLMKMWFPETDLP